VGPTLARGPAGGRPERGGSPALRRHVVPGSAPVHALCRPLGRPRPRRTCHHGRAGGPPPGAPLCADVPRAREAVGPRVRGLGPPSCVTPADAAPPSLGPGAARDAHAAPRHHGGPGQTVAGPPPPPSTEGLPSASASASCHCLAVCGALPGGAHGLSPEPTLGTGPLPQDHAWDLVSVTL